MKVVNNILEQLEETPVIFKLSSAHRTRRCPGICETGRLNPAAALRIARAVYDEQAEQKESLSRTQSFWKLPVAIRDWWSEHNGRLS